MRKSSIERKLDEERKAQKAKTSRYKATPNKRIKKEKEKSKSSKHSKIKDFDLDDDDEIKTSLNIVEDDIEDEDEIDEEVNYQLDIKKIEDEDDEEDDEIEFDEDDEDDEYDEDEEEDDDDDDDDEEVGRFDETIVFNYDELNELLERSDMNRQNGKRTKKNNKKTKGSRQEEKRKYSVGDKIKIFFTHLIRLGTLGIIVGMVLMYGPYSKFREWWVSTAMTTMTHKYLATWFFDDLTIQDVLNKNKVVESNESTNTELIVGANADQPNTYANEYERQILERDPKNNDYKIIPINGKGYSGYLTAVYEPQRIHAVATAHLGVKGQYVVEMAEENNALIAINGGGFNDPNFNSTGGSPLGITVSRGNFVTQYSYNGSGGLIGFDDNNNFICGRMTVTQAKNAGIRDAVTFGPFLIVNGKSSAVLGNGGWGDAPRTAIGQRADGIVLFLVLDGRTATNLGADMDDLIEIMERYGAINAANLDGGTSSVLVVNNTIVNDPIDSSGAHKTRPISTAFIVDKDESDDSDHSLVKSKLE